MRSHKVTRVLATAVGSERAPASLAASLLAGCAVGGFVVGALVASFGGDDGGDDQVAVSTGGPWEGDVTAVTATVAQASCESDPSRDASGERVTYEPDFAVDDDPESAWRCPGDGVNESLVLDLGGSIRVAEVGLVPGYAKTDPADDTDRYAENRRLTAVRWRFDDGTTVEQELDPDPDSRDLQTMRIPPVATTRLVLEIVTSSDGDRDTVAVSDLRIATPA
jgi:hypothetical protein